MSQAIWSPDVKADLLNLWNYIAVERSNPAAADKLIENLLDKATCYAGNPDLGSQHDEIGEGFRIFQVQKTISCFIVRLWTEFRSFVFLKAIEIILLSSNSLISDRFS